MPSPRARCCLLALVAGLALAPAARATVDPLKLDQDSAPNPVPPDPAPAPASTTTPADATPATPAPAPAPATPVPPAADSSSGHPAPPPSDGERVECSLALEAAPFLREASSRGIQPRAVGGVACDMSPADNRFFGPGGDAPCKLQFDNAGWLKPGMRFSAMTGVGTFDARTSTAGVDVTIPPDGGVRFQRVAVRLTVRKPATCPAPQPRNVLAD